VEFGWRILPVGEAHDQPAAVAGRPPEERALGKGISKSRTDPVLFRLVASGQIKLRRIDGWRKIVAVLRKHTAVAA
jgi:hypothetical protein